MLTLLAVTLLAPVDVVLLGPGDALLMACHDAQNGWYTGRACLAAAAGTQVHQKGSKSFTLGPPKQAKCGGTEGHFAFGPAPADGPIFSAGRPHRACPERKPYHLPDAQAKAVQSALIADMKLNPHAYATLDERKLPPIASQFSMNKALVVDIEGKGKTEEIISLTDMARGLGILVRLDGNTATVLGVNPFGMIEVDRDHCGDFDGDGVAEVIVSEGGETERVYQLVRFVRGQADVVAAMGCGD